MRKLFIFFIFIFAILLIKMVSGATDIAQASTNNNLDQTFYVAGRFWVFYYDGSTSYFSYNTSIDGVSWTSASNIMYGVIGDVHFDGTYFHFAASRGGDGQELWYRRGMPNGDGSITWSASWQEVFDPSGDDRVQAPSIAVTGSGKPVIAFRFRTSSGHLRGRVFMSSRTDGTWPTGSGYLGELYDNDRSSILNVIGLSGDKFYVFYAQHQGFSPEGYPWTITGIGWDGAWDGGISLRKTEIGDAWHAVADGDVIHFVMVNEKEDSFEGHMLYIGRSASGSWGSWTDLGYFDTDTYISPRLSKKGSDIYLFYGYPDSGDNCRGIVYRRRTSGGEWDEPVQWISSVTLYDCGITTDYEWGNNVISVVYDRGSSTPTMLRYEQLSLIPTISSISEEFDPILQEHDQTITPSGVNDVDRNDLRIYCCQDTSNSCTPTSANTCNNNQPWSYPYNSMTCLLTMPIVSSPTTYYARCRLYDGTAYSSTVSTSYVVNPPDITPPSWQSQGQNDSIISQGDAVELYVDLRDQFGVDWAWLSTDESGSWQNHTSTGGSCIPCPVGHIDNGDGTCTVGLEAQEDGWIRFFRDSSGECDDSWIVATTAPENCFTLQMSASFEGEWNPGFESSSAIDVTRSYAEWNLSSIPDGSNVNDAVFVYHGSFVWGYGGAYLTQVSTRPSQNTKRELFNDLLGGNYIGFSVVTAPYQTEPLSAGARNNIESSLNRDWFAMGLKHMYEGMGSGTYVAEIRSTESGGADPKPTLMITYSPPNPGSCLFNMNDIRDTWGQAKFYWQNLAIPEPTTVNWRIFFNDTEGNEGSTNIMNFNVGVPVTTTTTTTSTTTTSTTTTSTTTTSTTTSTTTTIAPTCSFCGDIVPCSGADVCDSFPGECMTPLGVGEGDCDCDANCQAGLYCDQIDPGTDYCCPFGEEWDGSQCDVPPPTTTSTTTSVFPSISFCCMDPSTDQWKCWDDGFCCNEYWSGEECYAMGGNQVNFSGYLNYSNGTPLTYAGVKSIITYQNQEFTDQSISGSDGYFLNTIGIPSYLVGEDFLVTFVVRNDIEAIYECWYEFSTGQCNP